MPSFSPARFRQIVLASAWYDLLVTAPFATPWTFALVRDHLDFINRSLGGAPLPAFEPFHVFFVCLFGSIVLVWSVLRIRDPRKRFGRYDGAGRFLFSTWMVWLLATAGAPVLWVFLVPEFSWGVVQWWPVASDDRRR